MSWQCSRLSFSRSSGRPCSRPITCWTRAARPPARAASSTVSEAREDSERVQVLELLLSIQQRTSVVLGLYVAAHHGGNGTRFTRQLWDMTRVPKGLRLLQPHKAKPAAATDHLAAGGPQLETHDVRENRSRSPSRSRLDSHGFHHGQWRRRRLHHARRVSLNPAAANSSANSFCARAWPPGTASISTSRNLPKSGSPGSLEHRLKQHTSVALLVPDGRCAMLQRI